MNINKFKKYINKTILDIGYDYYNEGNILEAKNTFMDYKLLLEFRR